LHIILGKENTRSQKKRLDLILVERQLVPSRSNAKAVIMSGVVYVNGQKTDKAGTLVDSNAEIVVKDTGKKYVSRGGNKLEAAIEHFDIDVKGLTAVDIGSSTGGFTDCLLQYGAEKVYALDVGYGQLDWRLRNDPRVIVKERINCRYLKKDDIDDHIDIAVIDVSFISLIKISKPVVDILSDSGRIIALIKPQFEVGKGEVGKGGIVTDTAKHEKVVNKIKEELLTCGCHVIGVIPSPITGADGNREFLVYALKKC